MVEGGGGVGGGVRWWRRRRHFGRGISVGGDGDAPRLGFWGCRGETHRRWV
jgi:hypothetical protein